MNKALFLDIDGVLATENATGWWSANDLRSDKIALLNSILDETNADLIISSTWRLKYSIEELQVIFNSQGFTKTIRDYTPRLSRIDLPDEGRPVFRFDEIQSFLSRHPKYTHFAIVDDEPDLGPLTPHLIWCSPEEGLTVEKAQRVVAALGPTL